MTTTGLLDLGIAEVAHRKTGELLGYVFTAASGNGQLQRWLLFQNPHNELEIRKAPGALSGWSLADWQANLPSLWRPGGFYVWAQADVYHYRGNYQGTIWDQIPAASKLPAPTFPERPGSSYQLDYLDGSVVTVAQEDWQGQAYVVRGISAESSIEYWSLPATFQPAGKTRAVIEVSAEQVSSLDAFISQANRRWAPDSTFVITGCLNYNGTAAPFAP